MGLSIALCISEEPEFIMCALTPERWDYYDYEYENENKLADINIKDFHTVGDLRKVMDEAIKHIFAVIDHGIYQELENNDLKAILDKYDDTEKISIYEVHI